MFFIAFMPGYFINLLCTVLNTNTFPNMTVNIADFDGCLTIIRNISLASAGFLVFTGFLFIMRMILNRKAEKRYSSTWGCAYVGPNERMQYTGKSFSKSFGKVLNFMLIEKKGYREIERSETFPVSRKYRSFYLDFIENQIINPSINVLTRFINLFQFIQNGKIQAYVIYGIVFILVIFLTTYFNF
jgi:hydrogenase-4 component B